MFRLELSDEDCLTANSRSTGPQQQNTDDHNCPVDNAERSLIEIERKEMKFH